MFKDLSETGSPIGKLRNKFSDLNTLLVEYSFKKNQFSDDLTKQKIIVTFNEAIEIANKCSNTDRVRLYFPSKTLEPKVKAAMKAAQYWVDFVIEKNEQFTNSLAILLIERAENDILNQANSQMQSLGSQNTLGSLLPNFVSFMNHLSTVIKNCHCVTDSSTKIEYKSPILTYGKIMGYNHIIIDKNSSGKFEMYQVTNAIGGKQIFSSKKLFSDDLSIEKYDVNLNSILTEVASNPLYLEIAIAGL